MTIHTKMNPLDRVRQRPFEHLIAFTFVLASFTRLQGGGPVVGELTGATAVAWSFVLMMAAALVLIGLHWRGDPVIRGTVELVGWCLGIAAAVGGPLILWFSGTGQHGQLTDDLILAGAAGMRVWYLHMEIQAIKRLRGSSLLLAKAESEEGSGGG